MPKSELDPRCPVDPAAASLLFVAPERPYEPPRVFHFRLVHGCYDRRSWLAISRPSRTITPCYRGRSTSCVETAIR